MLWPFRCNLLEQRTRSWCCKHCIPSKRPSCCMQEEARTVAIVRMLGIMAGVAMTLILSVTILPVSAHFQHDEALNKALRALLSLQALCWVPLTHAHEANGPSFLAQNPPPVPCSTTHEHSLQATTNIDCPGHEMARADSCAAPLLSPSSSRASPTRSYQLPLPRATPRDEESMHGAPTGSPLYSGVSTAVVGSGGLDGGLNLSPHAQQIQMHAQHAHSSSFSHPSPRQIGVMHSARGSGGAGPGGTAHETHRSSSSGGCGGSSGRGSFAGVVKRSEFANMNWELHNLKLNEEGDIRSAEDIVVEVLSTLSSFFSSFLFFSSFSTLCDGSTSHSTRVFSSFCCE
jgi:hypothetical protein